MEPYIKIKDKIIKMIEKSELNWVCGRLEYVGEDAHSHIYRLNQINISALKNSETDIKMSKVIGKWCEFNTTTMQFKYKGE